MPRIKKRGLDYFPMNTDFIHDRLVRRIMKREGDAALAVLVEALSYIYAGEGYYVRADELFYEDLSANLYEKSAGDVERIINLAVEYGVFVPTLFSQYGILTSVDIQRQYLFSTKRRSTTSLDPAYCLLDSKELSVLQAKAAVKCQGKAAKKPVEENLFENENVTFTPENVTSGTHSIAQHSIAQQSIEQHSVAKQRKEYPLPSPPKEGEKREEEKEEIFSEKNDTGWNRDTEQSDDTEQPKCTEESKCTEQPKCTERPIKRKEWTNERIDELQPPTDSTVRNYEGLLYNMRLYDISPSEQYAIIRKSDFGAIGGPVWKGFCILRNSNGKIKLPGKYLLSLTNKVM